MKAFGLGKKAGLGVLQAGKSTVSTVATTSVSVAASPVRTVTKAKVVSESHTAKYYSGDVMGSEEGLMYLTNDYAWMHLIAPPIRLSQLRGQPLTSAIPSTRCASASLPLRIDDIGFEHVWEESCPAQQMPVSQLLASMKTPAEGFTRYVRKVEVNRTKSTSMWVESGGAIFAYSKSAAAGVGNKASRYALVDLQEIRLGHKTQVAPSLGAFLELMRRGETSFADGAVDIIAPSVDVWKHWVHGLARLASIWRSESSQRQILRAHWGSFQSSALTYSQMLTLFRRLNISEKAGKALLQDFGMKENSPALSFQGVANILEQRWVYPTLRRDFDHYAQNSPMMTADAFAAFLREKQKVGTMDGGQAYQLIAPFVQSEGGITFKVFHDFMVSVLNDTMNWAASRVYQDMEQPLPHYYMHSSHNTYCSTDQLVGDSHVEMYRQVLLKGTRCVELDCWDGPAGEPVVYHGNTMTSRIYVRDICQAVKDFGFVTTPYPIVLSLEVHCGEEQQGRMAEIFSVVFGIAFPHTLLVDHPDLMYGWDTQGKAALPCQALSDLMFMRSAKLPAEGQTREWYQCCSLTESAQKKTPQADMIEHNKAMFTRIYPAGNRVGSSNYNPDPSWAGGSQLVALNLQSFDRPTMKNLAKFRDNGCCGYLLKPAALRESESTLPPPKTVKVTVCVFRDRHGQGVCIHGRKQLVGARNLPRGTGSHAACPFAKIYVEGVAADQKSVTTSTVSGNGFNPQWNQEVHTFVVTMGYCAILIIDIYDQKTSTSLAEMGSGSKNSVGGVGLSSIAGIGKAGVSAVGTAVAIGASATPGIGESASKSLATRVARCAIPVDAIHNGYRVNRLFDNRGLPQPLCDVLCHFEVL